MPSHVIKEGAGLEAADVAEGWGGKFRRSVGAVRVGACLGTGLAILLATGCSGSSSNIAQPLSSTSSDPAPSSSTSSGPNGSVSQQVLVQYRAFWSIVPAASAASVAKRQFILEPYADDPELASLLKGMRQQDRSGQMIYGRNLPRARVQSLSVQQRVAVVRDCQDSSHSGVEEKKSGRHLTVGKSRNLVVATMRLGDDGMWRVSFISYPKSTC